MIIYSLIYGMNNFARAVASEEYMTVLNAREALASHT